MAIELNLVKSDSASWGFRLTGGAEYDVPLTVIKVTENGIAETGGLQVDDILVRVNDTPTTGLTHSDAHNVILSAGNNLTLAIRRGNFLPEDKVEEINEEVCKIMQEAIELDRKVHFEAEAEQVQEVEVKTTEIRKEEAVEVKERKWSTFLQKPRNAKPALKKSNTVKGEPYRVVIKKQKKKQKIEEQKIEEPVEAVENGESPIEVAPEDEVELEEYSSDDDSAIEREMQEALERERKKAEEMTRKILEQKLGEVQKQLEALSQLPTTIQMTIDSLNKQICSIVSGNLEEEVVEERVESEAQEEEINSEANTDTEHELTNPEADLEDVSLKREEEEVPEEIEETVAEEIVAEIEKEKTPEPDIDPDEGLTEEEKEARRIEQELFDKREKERVQLEEFKQRRLEQRPTLPLQPLERPIILPGGRRWSQPDDACPSVRQSKMSDEKIANTIENFSEVIFGKTKGINFLKYQPPPKNLDYLQKSDVYRLVHDLEPPVRGICSRVDKILAEQDYYQREDEV